MPENLIAVSPDMNPPSLGVRRHLFEVLCEIENLFTELLGLRTRKALFCIAVLTGLVLRMNNRICLCRQGF